MRTRVNRGKDAGASVTGQEREVCSQPLPGSRAIPAQGCERADGVGHNEHVSYFAAVFAQTPQGWVGTEAVLDEAESVDDIADLMREAAVESYGDPVVLLVEQDDDWFAVVRLDRDDEPRPYISAVRGDGLASLFQQLVGDVPDGDAAGDAALLEDLGVDAGRLGELGERALPGDALLSVAERAGFGEEFDRLRD